VLKTPDTTAMLPDHLVIGEVVLDAIKRRRSIGKPLRAPWLIAIAVEPASDPSVLELEEIAAGCAAAQNMLLAADALGLAAIRRSGWIMFEPEISAIFQLSSRARMLGIIYIGYPAMIPPARSRKDIAEVTTWMGRQP